ncbi:adenylyl-sulfate kinase [Paraburkholderia panacisoli]|uniref:adenylyl-sulfate kinase n=1 Tax=Paraburkholderia panacisoli TaxID=2603818 RepID=UPI00319E1F46
MARQIIGKGFVEVFVETPLELCAHRDPKGLYACIPRRNSGLYWRNCTLRNSE